MLLEHQRLHRQAELDSGLCLSGAHKDDLEMALDGNSVKAYASQGQSRTAALSLKLAEREILKAESGEYPILLLDDVLSELDESRQNYVLNRIGGGQVFITCCEDGRIADRTGGPRVPGNKRRSSSFIMRNKRPGGAAMYLHLGQNVVVPQASVIGIFDLDNSTSSPITRAFLNRAEKQKQVVNVSEDLPKSFALCCEGGVTRVYLSQLSSATLLKRSETIGID